MKNFIAICLMLFALPCMAAISHQHDVTKNYTHQKIDNQFIVDLMEFYQNDYDENRQEDVQLQTLERMSAEIDEALKETEND
jgi:hypothetical protein